MASDAVEAITALALRSAAVAAGAKWVSIIWVRASL